MPSIISLFLEDELEELKAQSQHFSFALASHCLMSVLLRIKVAVNDAQIAEEV
jgi:hypothetical protein